MVIVEAWTAISAAHSYMLVLFTPNIWPLSREAPGSLTDIGIVERRLYGICVKEINCNTFSAPDTVCGISLIGSHCAFVELREINTFLVYRSLKMQRVVSQGQRTFVPLSPSIFSTVLLPHAICLSALSPSHWRLSPFVRPWESVRLEREREREREH
jgi:hypothetical protein